MSAPVKFFKKKEILILIWILLALHLIGCASRTEIPAEITLNSEFPTGLLNCEECKGFTMRISESGKLAVYQNGSVLLTGKWSLEGEVFFTGDSFCRDTDEMPASYQWSFDGTILRLKVNEDPCSDRVYSLDEKPWKLIEEE